MGGNLDGVYLTFFRLSFGLRSLFKPYGLSDLMEMSSAALFCFFLLSSRSFSAKGRFLGPERCMAFEDDGGVSSD
jgi:hypothetical protein